MAWEVRVGMDYPEPIFRTLVEALKVAKEYTNGVRLHGEGVLVTVEMVVGSVPPRNVGEAGGREA